MCSTILRSSFAALACVALAIFNWPLTPRCMAFACAAWLLTPPKGSIVLAQFKMEVTPNLQYPRSVASRAPAGAGFTRISTVAN